MTAAARAKARVGMKNGGNSKTLTSFQGMSTNRIEAVLQPYAGKISQLMPEDFGIDTRRFLLIVSTLIARQPKIAEGDAKSTIGAVLTAAMIGLDPTPELNLVSFVKRKGRTCCEIMYGGYIRLAQQSGEVDDVYAHVVHENDDFHIDFGSNAKVIHSPAKGQRGKKECVYAIWKLRNGREHIEYMTEEEVLAVKAVSPASGSEYSPWNTNFVGQMWKKSVIKRSRNYVPLSMGVLRKMALDGVTVPDPNVTFDKELCQIDGVERPSIEEILIENQQKEVTDKNVDQSSAVDAKAPQIEDGEQTLPFDEVDLEADFARKMKEEGQA